MVTKNSAAYWLGSSSEVPEVLMIDCSQDFILFIPHISCMHMFIMCFIFPDGTFCQEQNKAGHFSFPDM